MSDITLVLGDFTFQDMEIPEVVSVGGPQRLSIKKLIGGVRVIDDMGPDPKPIEWSGIFFPTQAGESALERAQAVEQMKLAGQPLTLSWDGIYVSVYISNLELDYRFARIPYRISCEILQDLAAPVDVDAGPDADDLINGDMDSINTLTPSVGNSTLSSLTATLSSAVSSVKTFVGAAQSTIASVLAPLNAARAQVRALIGATDGILSSVASVAGVIPGLPIAQNIAKFEAQLNAATGQTSLLQLDGLMGRMGANLAQVNSSVRVITVASGNLYDIAAKEYGDATAWTRIAQANKLTDPTLNGITTLAIPPYDNGTSGGIFSA